MARNSGIASRLSRRTIIRSSFAYKLTQVLVGADRRVHGQVPGSPQVWIIIWFWKENWSTVSIPACFFPWTHSLLWGRGRGEEDTQDQELRHYWWTHHRSLEAGVPHQETAAQPHLLSVWLWGEVGLLLLARVELQGGGQAVLRQWGGGRGGVWYQVWLEVLVTYHVLFNVKE